jgi:uncharacterized protein YdbL (DUF1318 family)
MKKISTLSALLLTACVTINIYFPAAAADKVADEVIKEIQGVSTQEKSEPEARANHGRLAFYYVVDRILAVIISPAHAAGEADLSIKTVQINKLRHTMKQRFSVLQENYASGLIGIKADGFLVVRNLSEVPFKNRNQLKKLVASENNDRQTLYQTIANANGHPEWYVQIKTTFARHWLSNANIGWWYQTASGAWQQR